MASFTNKMRSIKRILKKKNIDAVYERHGENYATKIAFEMDIPTVLEVNGIASAEAKIQGADKKTGEELDRLEKEKLKMPNKIVTVTDGIKNYWVSNGMNEKKFVVIPNGVNIDFFKPLDKDKCRKELRLDNSPLIVFVGSFAPWQGLKCAIKTMPCVLKEIPEARLVLVGDAGEYGGHQFHPTIKELKSLAKEEKVEKNVIFTGRVSYNEVLKYVNAADVCIAPKKHLRSGYSTLKLYEYLACEKAVIGSKANGIGNFLITKNCGVAIDVNDPTNFAKKMVVLLKNKELRMQMGRNGRKSVIDNFSWQKTTKKIEKILYEVVGDF